MFRTGSKNSEGVCDMKASVTSLKCDGGPQDSCCVIRKVAFDKMESLKISEKQLVKIKDTDENINWKSDSLAFFFSEETANFFGKNSVKGEESVPLLLSCFLE